MRMFVRDVLSIVLVELLKPFRVALIVVLALLVVSCRSTKQMESQTKFTERHDSVSRNNKELSMRKTQVAIWKESISGDTTHLNIPVEAIARLPDGASFVSSHGRAQVKASVSRKSKEPQIEIVASCDSLEQMCIWYESQYDSLQKQADYLGEMLSESYSKDVEKTLKTDRMDGIDDLLTWLTLIIGVILGFTIGLKK